MAELLLRQIDGENLDGLQEVIPVRMVWRDSAGRPGTTTVAPTPPQVG